MDLPLFEPLWLNWFALALGLLCLDLPLRTSHLTRLGLAALLAALAARLLGDALWPLHFLVFALLAAAALRFGRGKKRPASARLLPPRQLRQAQEGRRFRLAEPMHGGTGQIKLGGTIFLLRGPELPAGTEVVVLEQQGETLLVADTARIAKTGDF